MNFFSIKVDEISCNNQGIIIEFTMAFLVLISSLFSMILNITRGLILIFLIFCFILSTIIVIYKFIEIYKSKILLFDKGMIIIRPFKRIVINKYDIELIHWSLAINTLGPLPLCHKCNIKLKGGETINISSKSYKLLYYKLNKYKFVT